jgi:uncharacterized protein YjbI with pentapeptide repeats
MKEIYITDKTFERCGDLAKGEYENCTFDNCDFSESDFSEYKFIDCAFKECNLSLMKINRTSFQNANFIHCKMLGLRFDTCNEFGLSISFESCQLNHSSFYKTKIKKIFFKNSHLQEADFTETDFTDSVFDNCDMERATFDQTLLEKVDFRTSINYSIDPELNRIKKAKFSIFGVVGLLDKYDIEIEHSS